MANITINSTPTRVQYTATVGQTDFSYTYPIKSASDLRVYKRAAGSDPDDAADLLTITTDYTVTGANTAQGGLVQLVVAASAGDIVTIVGDRAIDRIAIYDQSVTFTKENLNNDFNDNVMFDKQTETILDQLTPKYNRSELIAPGVREDNLVLPILNDGYIWIGRGDNGDDPDDIEARAIGDFDALGLLDAVYILGAPEPLLPNSQDISALTDGVMVNNGGTILTRTITGTTNQIIVTNGSGVSGNPTISLDPSVITGLDPKDAARAATTANLNATYDNGTAGVGATLTNAGAMAAISIDGVSLNANDRVLVKNQTSTAHNGIYEVTTVGDGSTNWVLTRTTDYDQAAEIDPNDFVSVTEGTTNANTAWLQTEAVATVGTDPILWTQLTLQPNFSAADKYWYGGVGGVVTEGDIPSSSRTIVATATEKAFAEAIFDGTALDAVGVLAGNDKVLIQDTSDSDNLKTTTATDIANLGSGTGSWVYLGNANVSNATHAEFTGDLTATYDYYVIAYDSVVPHGSSRRLYCRFGTGGTPFTGGADYDWSTTRSLITVGNVQTHTDGSDSKIDLTGVGDLTNAANYVSNGTVEIFLPSGSTWKQLKSTGVRRSLDTGRSAWTITGAEMRKTDAITDVRFYMSSGNITGNFYLWGVKNT